MTTINLQIIGLQEDEKLWRYMDLSKFISLLEKNALWLARADTFRDRHEGRFPSEMRKIIERAYASFDENDGGIVKDADDFQDYLTKNTFINCWHKNSEENMVMWEIYARHSNSVAIQTSAGLISDNLTCGIQGHSLILKSVDYRPLKEISGVLRYEECFFLKRPHFKFENEVRLCLDTYSKFNPIKNNPYGHYIDISCNSFIEKILVHPDSQDWFIDVVSSIVNKYQIKAPIEKGAYGNT